MNVHINYYGQEQGKGTPLVFFHGWGFDSHIWLSLVSFLQEEYQLILVDLPGFGYTSIMDWPGFKFKLLAQLPAQFTLIGWSMGGLFATRLAIEEPLRVNKLFNIASSPRFIADPYSQWPGVTKELFSTFYHKLVINFNKTLNEFIELQNNKNKFDYVPSTPLLLTGLKFGLDILQTWDLREEIKNMTIPVSFMFGGLDSIKSINTLYSMRILYPNFKYIFFKRAAHMPFLSHPELFIKELKEFIA